MDEEQSMKYKKTQPLVFADSFRFVAEMPGPRTIKSHLHWNFLPRDLRQPDSKAKVSDSSFFQLMVYWQIYVGVIHEARILALFAYGVNGLLDGYAEAFDTKVIMTLIGTGHILQ